VRKLRRLISGAGRKFVSRPGEALLLCRMGWWVAVLSFAARWYSLPRALRIVAGTQNSKRPSQETPTQDELARAIDLLLSADVLMFTPVCWKRAAVLHRYLLRNGIATRIVFGVRSETGGEVAGHAWLEADGQPILESSPPEYVVTYSFPSNERFDPQQSYGNGHKQAEKS
jgi:Transglutaminase-like superfamily